VTQQRPPTSNGGQSLVWNCCFWAGINPHGATLRRPLADATPFLASASISQTAQRAKIRFLHHLTGCLNCVYVNQVKHKAQHGGRRAGAGRKTRLSTGMALTIRVDRDLLLRLSPMATERRVPIRALIVDLLRERCNLPAIPPSPATRAERDQLHGARHVGRIRRGRGQAPSRQREYPAKLKPRKPSPQLAPSFGPGQPRSPLEAGVTFPGRVVCGHMGENASGHSVRPERTAGGGLITLDPDTGAGQTHRPGNDHFRNTQERSAIGAR
jgi:hypothetical protein